MCGCGSAVRSIASTVHPLLYEMRFNLKTFAQRNLLHSMIFTGNIRNTV